jgi:hypothetical protein
MSGPWPGLAGGRSLNFQAAVLLLICRLLSSGDFALMSPRCVYPGERSDRGSGHLCFLDGPGRARPS